MLRQHIRRGHRERQRPGVVRDPGMCRRSFHGNRRSRDRPFGNSRRSASGRRGAVADDARSREVRPCHSSCEADEQSVPTAAEPVEQGRGPRERAPAKARTGHRTGARGTSAGRVRQAARHGRRRVTASHHISIDACDAFFRAQTRCRPPGWMDDVADLTKRP